jgi:polysaccharide export outer membrane protein
MDSLRKVLTIAEKPRKLSLLMKKILLITVFLLGSPMLECPGAFADTVNSTSSASASTAAMVGAGDILSIGVLPVEEYSREVTVSPDGRIEMPLIGTVLVKGLTTREIQELLQKKYVRYVSNPQISINVKHFSGRRIAIFGDVHVSGYFEYRDGMKMLELLAMANGFNDTASVSKIWVLRQEQDGRNRSFRVNYNKILKGDPTRDIVLQPGDTVYVPKQVISTTSTFLNINILPWVALTAGVLTILLAQKALKND